MTSLDIRRKIEKKIEEKYISNKNEWVNVYIDPRNYIDVKLVSDSIDNKRECKKFIENIVSEYEGYKKGLIRIFSILEAEEYSIRKSSNIKKPETLTQAIEYVDNSYEIKKEKIFKSQVISFYSYKGGVGRTLSMIHTAYSLAKRGKNVLMIDLDIEAPSLHNIFKEDAKKIEYGLIDYIYNRMHERGSDKEISINDIYSKVEINESESSNGNLYFIPAGKLNKEYIYKLSKIKPELVSRDNYINELIREIEGKQELNLDMVLIDSRTGINDWGAISLIDMSDKVVFFTYPNNENIEGTTELINLIKNIKGENLTVVFSRGDQRGRDKSRELFDELKLNQEYMEILYDPSIAIANEFPIQNMLNNCEKLADVLLEAEYININKSYLRMENNNREDILKRLLERFIENNVVRKDYLSRSKIEEENIYLILSKNKKVLDEYIKNMPSRTGTIYINLDSEVAKDMTRIEKDNHIFKSLNNKYIDAFWNVKWHLYLIEFLNSILKDKYKLDIELNSNIKSDKVENYMHLIDLYKNAIDNYYKQKEEDITEEHDSINTKNKLMIFIEDTGSIEDEMLVNCIEELKKIELLFEKYNVYINIKLFKEEKNHKKDIYIHGEIKPNIAYLEWKLKDIENAILEVISDSKDIFGNYKKLIENKSKFETKHLLDLFLGKRADSKNKLERMSTYFYNKLVEINGDDIVTSNKIIIDAIKNELDSPNKEFSDRIISFDSIEKAFDNYKINN